MIKTDVEELYELVSELKLRESCSKCEVESCLGCMVKFSTSPDFFIWERILSIAKKHQKNVDKK